MIPSTEAPVFYLEYLRVSTDDQVKAATMTNQRNALARLAASRPGESAGRFEDPGVSGAVHLGRRAGWAALEAILIRGGVTELRIYDLSRLTRDDGLTDCEHLVRLMRLYKFVIVTADGEVIRAESSMDLLMLVIRALGAADERKRIRNRTMEGKLTQLSQGRPGAGCKPTGILHDRTAGWSLCPKWSPIIRRIFAMCIAGEPLQAICRTLDAEGIIPPKGSQWNYTWVAKIIKSSAYKGDLRQKQSDRIFFLKPPAMVDEETWDAAQAALAGRRHVPLRERYAVAALCRTLAHCGVCGERMWVHAGSPGRGPASKSRPAHTRYFCRTCKGAPYHRGDRVDAVVWDSVRRALVNADSLLGAAVDEPLTIDVSAAEIDEATAVLRRLDKKKAKLTSDWVADVHTDEEYNRQVAAIKLQQDHQNARLVAARKAQQASERAKAQQATFSEVVDVLRSRIEGADQKTRREILEAVVPLGTGQIRIYPDYRIEIRGVLPMVSEESPESAPT